MTDSDIDEGVFPVFVFFLKKKYIFLLAIQKNISIFASKLTVPNCGVRL